jgi:putative effector of murein hydrolase LrgA (UPF0299 family)
MDVIYELLTELTYLVTAFNLVFIPYFVVVLAKARLMHSNLRYLLVSF